MPASPHHSGLRAGDFRPLLAVGALLATLTLILLLVAPPAPAGAGQAPAAELARAKGKKHNAMYLHLWRKNVSRKNKRWANLVADCESGRRENAIGGGGLYRGAFQFMKDTWRVAPKSPGGDPIDYPYATQAFVAVRLKARDGAGHWPSCP